MLTAAKRLAQTVHAAAAALLLISVVINFANIIGRYFLSAPIEWGEEMMLFLMVGCVFFGNCVVGWDGRQIRMDVFVQMLPPTVRVALDYLSECAIIAVSLLLAVLAWPVIEQLYEFDQRSQAADFPLVYPQAMLPLGFLIIAILVLARVVGRLSGAIEIKTGH